MADTEHPAPELAITAGFGAFYTAMPSAGHRPHATKLLIPIEGTLTIRLEDEARTIESAGPVLIAAEIKHSVPCDTLRIAAFIDPETVGASVSAHIKLASHDGSVRVDPSRAPQIMAAGQASVGRFADPAAFQALCRSCTQTPDWISPVPHLDPRIHAVISKLVGDPEHRFKLDELAQVADLSARWLSKLFKETMGTSLRRYARWLKLADSVQLACKVSSLTDSAVAAGFADLPHFSRSVTELMGNSPSRVPFAKGSVHDDYFAMYRVRPPWDRLTDKAKSPAGPQA